MRAMSLTELINEMRAKGLIQLVRIIGGAKPVIGFVAILAGTDGMETDPEWWELRLWTRRN